MMYSFNVKWYYDDEEVEDTGIVCAHSFSDAMNKLSEDFGDHEMIKGTLELLSEDDSDILILNKDVKEFIK